MSANDRFERRLPVILDSLAPTRAPEYFDDILGQVDRTRQRPGWTFPERWLPVSAITNRLAVTPRIPMRAAIAVTLLVLGLVVGALLLAGSRPRVPAPFGPAANGQLVFIDETGAIRAGNPVDGTSSIIVAGSGNRLPITSPDGTRLAYLSVDELVVSDLQGRDPVVVATDGLLGTTYLGWTPDGRRVMAGLSTGKLVAYDVATDAKPSPMLETSNVGGLHNDLADLFRPPAGDEILEYGPGPQGTGLYRRPLNGGAQIAVLTKETTSVQFSNLGSPQWSPDGSQIAFSLHPPEDLDRGRAYIVNVDGSGLRRLSAFEPQIAIVDEGHLAWSPDGTKVAFGKWLNDPNGDPGVRPVTIVDVASGEEREVGLINPNGYKGWAWSPDGKSIVEVPAAPAAGEDADQVIVIDVETGKITRPGWTAGSAPTWQRMAP
jgi:WD40 repeat protein